MILKVELSSQSVAGQKVVIDIRNSSKLCQRNNNYNKVLDVASSKCESSHFNYKIPTDKNKFV